MLIIASNENEDARLEDACKALKGMGIVVEIICR